MSCNGHRAFSAQARCWPGGTPGQLLFPAEPFFFIQTPKEVWIIWQRQQEVRRIYLNDPHSAIRNRPGSANPSAITRTASSSSTPSASSISMNSISSTIGARRSVKQGLCVVWLFNKVHSPGFYRLDGNGNIGLAGYDDHRPADPTTFESAQEFKASDLGHSHIGDDTTSFGGRDGIKESLGGLVGADREISRTQQEPKSVARSIVIVDHMDHWITGHW